MGFFDVAKTFVDGLSEKTEEAIRKKLRGMTDDQLKQQYRKILSNSSSQKSIDLIENEMRHRNLL